MSLASAVQVRAAGCGWTTGEAASNGRSEGFVRASQRRFFERGFLYLVELISCVWDEQNLTKPRA